MKFEYETKITSARPNSKSVRTTVPKEVVQFMNLSEGNNIKWVVELTDDKIITTIVKKWLIEDFII